MEKSSVNITNKVEITEVEQSLEKKIYEPRQGFYYRGIGEDGLKDAIESGFFRSPTMRDTYKGIYKTSEIYWADANNFEVAKRASIRTGGSIMEGKSVIVEYPSVSEIIPKDRTPKYANPDSRKIIDNYASQTDLPLGNARILIGDRKTGIYNYIDFNQISPTDIEKFKEFILSKNEIQKIDDLSFEEVSPDTSDSIEVKTYKDDSEEIVLKKLKEKLIKENWWFQDEFKNEGFPKEQFIINGNQNEYSIYNFNENLSEEQKNSIIKGISFLENSNEISSLKDITILIRKIEKINSNSQQPLYGSYYEGSKVINIHPRALKNEGYREIPEISGLEATIIHEFSHPIYDKIEQKLKEEWSNFGWEATTEEERENENMYAIKPKESNKCITKYAQFAPDEDFCESVVGLYAKSFKLDSEKKTFLESNIFNEIKNIPLAQIIKKEKVELPKLPKNIKFHKKEVPKISIIKK